MNYCIELGNQYSVLLEKNVRDIFVSDGTIWDMVVRSGGGYIIVLYFFKIS